MGNFYVNFAVKVPDPQPVADALARGGRRAIVTPPRNGYVVVYDEEADRQATAPILAVGELLARATGRPVLASLNHDDSILCYWLFDGGRLVDSYNSNPAAFDPDPGEPPWQPGDAHRLSTIIGPGVDAAAVEAILRGDYVFAVERHQRLAETIGLPAWSVGLGYQYVVGGEVKDEDEGSVGEWIRVGG